MRRYLFDVWVNGVLASRVVAVRARWLLLRLAGVEAAASSILEGAYFSQANVSIGRGTYAGPGLYVHCRARVTIGADCAFGPQVMLMSGSHEIGTTHGRAGTPTFAPIDIGPGVWLGARVTVLPGVRIGSGCIVAAGAVVVDDLSPDGLYAGVPARLVRRLDGCEDRSAASRHLHDSGE